MPENQKAGPDGPAPKTEEEGNWLGLFLETRSRLFAAIRDALHIDGGGKSYEGAMSIHFPDYFDAWRDPAEKPWGVDLHCYIIGPNRHYAWRGHTLTEAVRACAADVNRWCDEFYAEHGITPEQPAAQPPP